MSISTAGTNASGALHHSAQWGFPNQRNIGGVKRAARSPQPVWQWLTRPGQGQEQQWPSPTPTAPIKESLGEHHQSGNGMAAGAGYAGRAQKHCRLSQEEVASTWQKATASLCSAPSMNDAAAHCASGGTRWHSGVSCRACSAEGRRGGRWTQVEELLWLLTESIPDTSGMSPYFPCDRPDRQRGCTTWRIPCPLSPWLNTVTEEIGSNGNKFLPRTAGTFSLWLFSCSGLLVWSFASGTEQQQAQWLS